MAIVFAPNVEIGRRPEPDEPQPGYEWANLSAALGKTPHPLTRAEYLALPTKYRSEAPVSLTVLDTSSLVGCALELKPGVFTREQEEIIAGNKLTAGSVLIAAGDYGIKWRVWVDGFPTYEQMAATPWENL